MAGSALKVRLPPDLHAEARALARRPEYEGNLSRLVREALRRAIREAAKET